MKFTYSELIILKYCLSFAYERLPLGAFSLGKLNDLLDRVDKELEFCNPYDK